MLKLLIAFATIAVAAAIAHADTPPPGVVGLKGATDGTKIGNVGDSLKVILNSSSATTVNQGSAGTDPWQVVVSPNANGSIVNNTSVTTTPTTVSAPANAVGFLLEAESGNTQNIRWAIGSAASTSAGVLMEPGRDTGYIPGSGNISVASVSGTQTVVIQWILSQ